MHSPSDPALGLLRRAGVNSTPFFGDLICKRISP